MNASLKKSFAGVAVVVNTLTFASGAMLAHEHVHEDILNSAWHSEGAKAWHAFEAASIGSIVAPGSIATDWRLGASSDSDYDSNTPVSYIAEKTPDFLQIPAGATFMILGAPGAAIGNFVGANTGYFAP